MTTEFKTDRYETMTYRRCGRSGLMLPALSLGLWHYFGDEGDPANAREMAFRAFNHGITHFDLANNYGRPAGSAETNFGKIVREMPRDELVISSKAGYRMWPGPYGERGSRKYLVASCDQSLERTGLDYFDIFYSHRPDPNTPLEETMAALEQLVRQGKVLYAGISSYNSERTAAAANTMDHLGEGRTPITIHQPACNMMQRGILQDGLPHTCERHGIGIIVFNALAKGLLTDKYLDGVPDDSRAGRGFALGPGAVTEDYQRKARGLNEIAKQRGQTLAQMAIAWMLRDERITSLVLGASRPEQIDENVRALDMLDFDEKELAEIDILLGF